MAPSADLVAWSRLGSSYSPDDLRARLDEQRLIELQGLARPCEDLALYRADMADWPGRGDLRDWQRGNAAWVRANNACRLDILDRLRGDGPLAVRDLPDICELPWRSSGWAHHKNVQRLLELLAARGEVAVVGREGPDRMWDLASRVYPDDPVVPAEEAERERDRRRLAALGIARPRGTQCPVDSNVVGDAGEPALVEGVRGEWRVDPVLLDQPFSGRAALLSPLGPSGLRSQAHGRALRVRLPARDVQARSQAPLGLFRAADPVRRPAGRQARRQGRSGGRCSPGRCPSIRTRVSRRP